MLVLMDPDGTGRRTISSGTERQVSQLRLRVMLWLVVPMLALSACAPLPPGQGNEAVAQRRLNALRDKPPQLREFLQRMPKGGDIHNHLSGAVYAEHYIDFASADGLCISTSTWQLSSPPCDGGRRPAGDAKSDFAFRSQVIDAWSDRDFVAAPGWAEGDQFFGTFDRFGGVSWNHTGQMLAEVMRTSHMEGLGYLELMISPAGSASRTLGSKAGLSGADEITRTVERIRSDQELTSIVSSVRTQLDQVEAQTRAGLRCGSEGQDFACDLPVRFLSQVVREFPKEQVLGQMVVAFELARADGRFVGLNLVGPEYGYTAMTDYAIHMLMLDQLHAIYPEVKIALHAGELTLGTVPPDGLTSHISEAVNVGHATRIGHGVSIAYEPSAKQLIAQMAKQRVAVEILLTSNEQILDVAGPQHPFQMYRSAGVVTILGTDDAGVSRSDMTNEYQKAVVQHGLGYKDLKQMARDSIEYSFLGGASLWKDAKFSTRVEQCNTDDPTSALLSADCGAFLDRNIKAKTQWRLERDLIRFEQATPRKD